HPRARRRPVRRRPRPPAGALRRPRPAPGRRPAGRRARTDLRRGPLMMKPDASSRPVPWPLVVAGVAVGLTVAAILARRSATARAGPPAVAEAAAEGVVCFGTVDLEHGVTALYPLQPGRVAEVPVRENQAVAKGAELL